MESLRKLCTPVAVHLQISGERTLPRDALAAMTEQHPALKHLKAFDVGGRSLLNRNAEEEYRFSHYSIQEFLVVRALAEGTLDLAQGELNLGPAAPERPTQRLQVLQPPQRLRLTDQIILDLLAHTQVVFDPGTIDLSSIRPVRDRLAGGSLGPIMQAIPAGSFWIGSAEHDMQADDNEKSQHQVTLGVILCFLGRYPVTYAEFDRFCDTEDHPRPDDWGWRHDNRPVINVSWEDAVAYCTWLSEQTGRHYRLPTEAEWEYGARAGSHTRWSFGDQKQDLDLYARFKENSGGQSQPVGKKRPNPWGCSIATAMSGNGDRLAGTTATRVPPPTTVPGIGRTMATVPSVWFAAVAGTSFQGTSQGTSGQRSETGSRPMRRTTSAIFVSPGR